MKDGAWFSGSSISLDHHFMSLHLHCSLYLVVNSADLEGVQIHILCAEGSQEHSSIRLKYKEILKKLISSVLHCIYATNGAAVKQLLFKVLKCLFWNLALKHYF